tara:strand:- start:888 stop:1169 length:282 start_codon:yes stop_codon:yes gene_type:complete
MAKKGKTWMGKKGNTWSFGGVQVTRSAYLKAGAKQARSKGLTGRWRFIERGTPTQVKSRKKLLESKYPVTAFRTSKDWKKGSRIIEVQEWFGY